LKATVGRRLQNREYLTADTYAAFSTGACIWRDPEVHRSVCGPVPAVGDRDPIVRRGRCPVAANRALDRKATGASISVQLLAVGLQAELARQPFLHDLQDLTAGR
jgi:hypothetical protein